MNLKSQLMPWKLLRKLFSQLSIRRKIVCGYVLSLGIAVLGTTGGLIVGDHYFQAAREKMVVIHQQASVLSNLQGVLLKIQVHQQDIFPLFAQKQALALAQREWQKDFQEMQNLCSRLKDLSKKTTNQDLKNLLQRYDQELEVYFENISQLLKEISLLSSQPEDVQKVQQLIWEFYQHPSTRSFYKYSHDIADLTAKFQILQKQENLAYQQSIKLQAQIIIASIVLSVIIATILAIYTSRVIASPINAVTNIAKRVTKEANFELQAPVTTRDEIGTLATTLNQLIQQVKNLLEIQQHEAQTQLIQSEKMSSLGRMLAGVAHEINNPVNFISGNLVHAQNYIDDLLTLLRTYQEVIPNPPKEVQKVAEEIDLEFLETDLPKIFNSMNLGTERTKEIVRSLKNFSRIDEGKINSLDLHPCIESTLLILNNRLKNKIQVFRKYGEIPLLPGYVGLLYQVFMNILSNAIDALEEKAQNQPQFSPEITIITECVDNQWVVVKIADNGTGISPKHQTKIFESFFTTKPQGIGTGLGLAITHQIVVEKHKGKIFCYSELNQGTEFTIYLPLHGVKK